VVGRREWGGRRGGDHWFKGEGVKRESGERSGKNPCCLEKRRELREKAEKQSGQPTPMKSEEKSPLHFSRGEDFKKPAYFGPGEKTGTTPGCCFNYGTG